MLAPLEFEEPGDREVAGFFAEKLMDFCFEPKVREAACRSNVRFGRPFD